MTLHAVWLIIMVKAQSFRLMLLREDTVSNVKETGKRGRLVMNIPHIGWVTLMVLMHIGQMFLLTLTIIKC